MNDSDRTSFFRRLRRSRTGLVLAVVGLGLVGFGAWKVLSGGDDQDEYLYAPVEVGDIEDLVTATGTLEPRDYVDVGAQVSGQILKIYVEVGDEVKVGDVLAEIDAEQARARVESNQANLAAAKISLESTRWDLEKSKRDYERQQALMAENATTREQLLNSETSYENAKRNVARQEEQIKQQEASMRIEARNLQYTKITAPIDGTVMSVAVKEGQTVNASQSVPNVLRIANLNTMTVRTDVSEADIAKVQTGMQVYFTTLGAGQNRRWYGEVKRKEPTPKNQQGVVLYPVLFDVQNEGNSLMPQATTQVFFVAAEARNVLTVPMAALQQGQQIAREMAQRERGEGEGEAQRGGPAMAANERGGGPPPGAAPGGSAPPAVVAESGASAPVAPGQAGAGNGQGPRGGQRGGGGFGGFDPEQMTPEQRAQFEQARARMREGGGQAGPGGFGGFRGMGAPGGGAGATRQPQQRRGIVMVKKADGTLESRQVVIGVTDRVRGQVLEGLEEGEEVVVALSQQEAEPAAAPTPQNQNFRGQGGFPGGGGGGFRPF
jgi:macrolide-specific efflux system membrane fusion protein